MLKRSREDTLKLLVSLVAINDEQIIFSDLISTFATEEVEQSRIQAITSLIVELRNGFDFCRSPGFELTVAGKSDAYIQMSRRLHRQPVRVRQAAERLDNALANLLNTHVAYQLLPETHHKDLDQIASALRSMHIHEAGRP